MKVYLDILIFSTAAVIVKTSPQISQQNGVCNPDVCSKLNEGYDTNVREPAIKDMLRGCINGTCGCPPDRTPGGGFYGGQFPLEVCVPKLMETGKPCGESADGLNFGCESETEICSSVNNTCWKCSFGRVSPTSGECTGPSYEDICSKIIPFEMYRMKMDFVYGLGCQEDAQECQSDEKYPVRTYRCKCREGYTYLENKGTCSPTPKLGEDCTESKECLDSPGTYGYTKCSEDNICVCKGLLKNTTNYCLQTPNGYCEADRQCPDHAGCVTNLEYVNECNCGEGFVNGDHLTCLPFKYGQTCEVVEDLETQRALEQQGLTCINDKYGCENPTEEYYDIGPEGNWRWDRVRHLCVKEVGAACNSTQDTRCTEGASCVESNEGFHCECGPGYSSTPENRCLKHVQYGESCGKELKCNHFGGIYCKRGECQCPHKKMRFDTGLQRCLSPEGHFCGKIHLGSGLVGQIECESDLKCTVPRGPKLSKSKCLKV